MACCKAICGRTLDQCQGRGEVEREEWGRDRREREREQRWRPEKDLGAQRAQWCLQRHWSIRLTVVIQLIYSYLMISWTHIPSCRYKYLQVFLHIFTWIARILYSSSLVLTEAPFRHEMTSVRNVANKTMLPTEWTSKHLTGYFSPPHSFSVTSYLTKTGPIRSRRIL